ncbi:hypothetical protein E2C01_080246 [Portunus trituberculatus]|uniref:Uncharacterized protein n=1 Tax=Portunus trituberculatus TaxID=210409 RepID=A0A5B7IXX1_PORTR|nr:hypothetical protein [Portunus trituberculatus]
MDQTAFEEELCETQESKTENAVLQPTAERDKLIEDLLRINSHGATSPFDFNLKKRYEILRVGNAETNSKTKRSSQRRVQVCCISRRSV